MKREEESPAAHAEETWLKLKGLQSGNKEFCLLLDLKFPRDLFEMWCPHSPPKPDALKESA